MKNLNLILRCLTFTSIILFIYCMVGYWASFREQIYEYSFRYKLWTVIESNSMLYFIWYNILYILLCISFCNLVAIYYGKIIMKIGGFEVKRIYFLPILFCLIWILLYLNELHNP